MATSDKLLMGTDDDILDALKILLKPLQLIKLLHQAADAVLIKWFEVGVISYVVCQHFYSFLVFAFISL
jgi:hypothetical protein